MPNPWDVPPFPTEGDKLQDTTFASVGRALTAWEGFEVQLANLFAAICGAGDDTLSAVRAYGSVISFKGRSAMVKAAAVAYFHRFPNDKLAAALTSLLNDANKFSARRNEVAHGVVLFLRSAPDSGFALQPAIYASSKNLLVGGPQYNILQEQYAYSSKEIEFFTGQFLALIPRVRELWEPIYKARRPSLS